MLKSIQKHKNLIYDVGMHKGEDTDYYLNKGFKVIGFEADPNLINHCKNRFKNQIENEQLIIVEGAIVSPEHHDCLVKFFRNNHLSVWGTVCEQWANRNEFLGKSSTIIEVPAIRFSDCIEKYGMPYYLKVDIEGLDILCLKALLDFEQKPDYISIESEKVSFQKLIEELNLFSQLGYHRFQAIQQNEVPNQIEPQPAQEGNYLKYEFQQGSSGLFGKDLPNQWKTMQQVIRQYKYIFFWYRYFGDYGKLTKTTFGRLSKSILEKILRKSIPGWYDTHAQHSEIN